MGGGFVEQQDCGAGFDAGQSTGQGHPAQFSRAQFGGVLGCQVLGGGLPKDPARRLRRCRPRYPVQVELDFFLHRFGGHDRVLRHPGHVPGAAPLMVPVTGARPLPDSPARTPSTVLLPAPLSPSRAVISPGAAVKLRGPTAGADLPWYVTVSPLTATPAGCPS